MDASKEAVFFLTEVQLTLFFGVNYFKRLSDDEVIWQVKNKIIIPERPSAHHWTAYDLN